MRRFILFFFFFSSRRRHTRWNCDWSSDVCSSDLHDPKDTTSVNRAVPDYEAAIGTSVRGMKIGIPREYRLDGMPAEIEKLWTEGAAWLKAAGAELVDVSLPHTKYALPAYYIVAPAEASSNLARYDGVRYGLRVP